MNMDRMHSNRRYLALAAAIALGLGGTLGAQARGGAHAAVSSSSSMRGQGTQGLAGETQRDYNQQLRIEQGLQTGQLSTKEASQLEKGEARIDRTEHADLADGKLSASEQAQIAAMQAHESQQISNDRHNAQYGNPFSVSSERMQQDVGRNMSQEATIRSDVTDGTLTNRETGNLEWREAHSDHEEANVAANGLISASEQAHVEQRQSNNVGYIDGKNDNDSRR